MPTFRATVQLTRIEGTDAAAVRGKLEQVFGQAGLAEWRIVHVENEQSPPLAPVRRLPFPSARRSAPNPGLWLLIGAAVWAVWFFWSLIGEE